MTSEYPYDLFTAFNQAKGQVKTLSIEPFLYPADVQNGDKPYELYGKFSRFKMTLINNTTTPKTFISCNINLSSIPDIVERTRFVYHKAMEESVNPSSVSSNDSQNSPAYTVSLKGKFNGKTPAQVIAETGSANQLVEQRNYLMNSKYSNAQEQINAINDAINLMNTGMLQAPQKQAGMTGKFEIYNSGMRPLTRKARQDGMCPVNELHISWVFGFNSPVQIDAVTYYAPVRKFNNGKINVAVSEKDRSSEHRESFHLLASDWMDALSRMQRVMRQFEVTHAKDMFDTAARIEAQNRAAAQANSGAQVQNQNNIPQPPYDPSQSSYYDPGYQSYPSYQG